ncbi:hypothetical protein D3C75_1336260 [compost metagenome]|jgi:hypothetical protein
MTTETDMKAILAEQEEVSRNKEEQHAMADRIIKNCEDSLKDLAKRGDKRAQAEVLKRGLL